MSLKSYCSEEYFTQELKSAFGNFLTKNYGGQGKIKHDRENHLTLSMYNLTTRIEITANVYRGYLEARIESGEGTNHSITNEKRIKIIRSKTGRASPKMYAPLNKYIIKTMRETNK